MKITRRQLKRIIREEKQRILLEQGDPIADQLLGDFVMDLATQLTGMYDTQDIHRVGDEEEFTEAVNVIASEVEELVRRRLSDLWAGDIRLELRK